MAAVHSFSSKPWLFVLVAIAGPIGGCHHRAQDLLEGRRSTAGVGVPNAQVITDGRAAREGEDWNAPAAAVFSGADARVDWDLGQSVVIRGAFLQGDNNDDYVVSGSEDGATFRELWVAPPVADTGLRGRSTGNLSQRARWIRLTARGGDGHYSVSELQLFSEGGGWLGPPVGRASPEVAGARVRTSLLYLVVAIGLLLFATRAGSGWKMLVSLGLLVAAALAATGAAIAGAWPLAGREVSFARAVAAAIGLLALGRAAWRRRLPSRPLVVAAAGLGAALAFACFYNFGHPQFWNHARSRPMFVHDLDMRIYQPFAKYYGELRYDGVYLASVLAYAEDERGGSLASLASVEVRDQRDYQMRRVGDLGPEIRQVRARFSDARWAAFKRDMSFFRGAMGPGYLGSLNDHGANAPPVWVFFARLVLGHVTATEASLTAAGLVDGLLLLLMAVALARCFGVLPMLAAMTVFGATELYMFGTNWAGATLRHDWLVLVGLGSCAIKRGWFARGGAALGLAAMLRLVPGVALLGVVLVPAAWLVERWIRRGRPSLRTLVAENRGAVRVLAGAAATMVIAFLVTTALYSFSAWVEWWDKVRRLNDDLATNEVDLRVLLAGTDALTNELLRVRWPLIVAAQITGIGVVLAAGRRRPLEEAMVLALPLMMLLANTVNYHDHFVFLLPLVAVRAGTFATAAPLLATCIADYQAALDPDAGRRFQALTAILFAALGWYYAVVLRDTCRSVGAPRDNPPGSR